MGIMTFAVVIGIRRLRFIPMTTANVKEPIFFDEARQSQCIIFKQFGAAIDMFGNAVRTSPDELWRERLWENSDERPEYALFWLDLYLSGAEEGFAPPAPFTLIEMDPASLVPERPYTKEELLAYLDYDRKKCQATIEALTGETAQRRCRFGWGEVSFVELQLYNMRHIQEHAAQLSLLLGQKTGGAPDWVPTARSTAI